MRRTSVRAGSTVCLRDTTVSTGLPLSQKTCARGRSLPARPVDDASFPPAILSASQYMRMLARALLFER